MTEPEIRTYDSLDAMLTEMRQGEAYANAHLAPQQQRITFGDHWVRFLDIPGKVLIFGYVQTEAEITADEIACATPQEPFEEGELAYILDRTRNSQIRGHLYGPCHSVITPEGELGFTHASHVWPITGELFQAARAAEWKIEDLDPTAKVWLSDTYLAWATHEDEQRRLAAVNGLR